MRKILLVLYTGALAVLVSLTIGAKHSRPLIHEREVDNIEAKKYWEYLRLRDPKTGEIPRGIHARELAYARTLVPRSNSTIFTGTATIHTIGWNPAGPINAGGRTQTVAIDFANEANVLIATAQGGIFRSTDSGTTWTRAMAPDELKNTVSLVQDHRAGKTNVWYAGTGELLSTTERRVSATVGAPRWRTTDVGDGIYKSTDNGRSWALLPSTHDESVIDLDSTFDGVWNIVVDNSAKEQDIVYAAAFGEIMRSTDAGASWKSVLGDKNHRSFCTDVQITSTGILYAFLSQYSVDGVTPAQAGVWRSTDGLHWTNISPTFWPSTTQRLKIAIAPSNEKIVYVAGSLDSGGSYHGFYKYTYVSGDGSGAGGQWDDRSANLPDDYTSLSPGSGTLGGYAVVLKVHPTDQNIVFFGGGSLFRSTDGFSSKGYDWIGGYYKGQGSQMYPNHHPDNHDITFSFSNPSRAFSTNDGGVYRTDNVLFSDVPDSVEWQDINNHDVASIIYNISMDHATPGDTTLLGGFQDWGCWLGTANSPWDFTATGDGCYVAISDHQSAYYLTGQFGNIYQFIPSTYNWNYLTPPNGFNGATFVCPWLLDPTDTNVMFLAAGGTVMRNSNLALGRADLWEPLTYTTLDDPAATVTAFAVSVTAPAHMLFYGTSDGHLFRVSNVNATKASATEISGSNFPKDAFISCVSVDPENAQHILVCFSNYHVVSLFASDNGGTSWRNISGNLEQNPDGSGDGPSTRWITMVHQYGQTIYLCATSVGMFSTTDISGNVTWTPEGLSTIGRIICEHIDVRQSDGFVAIATQGEGAFTTFVHADQQQNGSVASESNSASSFSVSPNPANGRASVSLSMRSAQHVKLTVVDISGRNSEEIYDGLVGTEATKFNLDASRLPSGTYYVELITDQATQTRRIVIQH
jgi:photosystem II stability/assembly factor-like uncharacterized protein